ncbi:MAG TPA: ATP synthase F1 subunit epsilon [Acidimicrobiales bacterium]|jgi:F-type H+-transporting ATPase subunit epsilon|nr:ATP synthase F1 subunit epsilon [Acidimicrobiales bacterium]
MAATQVELVAPSRTLYSGEAEMVVCRTEGGEIAFLADHMPYLGTLEPCLVRVVQESGDELRAAVHGGFVEVRDNRVIMLANVAELADEIDVERARRAQSEAEDRVTSAGADEDAEAAAALRRAEVRIEVAG